MTSKESDQGKRDRVLALRRRAFEIVNQLPERPEDAAYVLAYADTLFRGHLVDPAPPGEGVPPAGRSLCLVTGGRDGISAADAKCVRRG